VEYIDKTASVRVGLHPVLKLYVRLAEKERSARILKLKQSALYRTSRLTRYIAVFVQQFRGMIGDIRDHRTQILEINEQPSSATRKTIESTPA